MCVCIYVCSTHVCMYVCVDLCYVCVYMHVNMYACIRAIFVWWMHASVYACNVRMYIRTYLWMYARMCRYRWSRGLRRRYAAAGLRRLWVRIPQGALMFVEGVVCCQLELSGRSCPESPTDCGESLCVIWTPQEWGGHGSRWAAKRLKNVCMHVCMCVYVCMHVCR
jgi:hypothetical protein